MYYGTASAYTGGVNDELNFSAIEQGEKNLLQIKQLAVRKGENQ